MQRNELLNALNAVKPGVSEKEIVESMTYFYFSGTHVCTYNDVISIQYPLKTDFKAFVKASDLHKVVSKIKGDMINFNLKGDTLELTASRVKTSFATINDEQIIKRINTVEESLKESDKKIKLPDDFQEAIKLCSFVASKKESDQSLTCIHIKGDSLTSSDNARIAVSTIGKKLPTMLLKASEVKSLLDTNPVSLTLGKRWIHFTGENDCTFSIRKITGEYPDFSHLMKFKGTKVDIPRSILDGVDIASIFVEENDPSIEVSLQNNKCRIYKDSANGKIDYREKVKYEGDPVTFVINPDFLKEMLAHSTEILIGDGKAMLNSGNFTMITAMYS